MGILDAYLARAGSGLLGGLYDDSSNGSLPGGMGQLDATSGAAGAPPTFLPTAPTWPPIAPRFGVALAPNAPAAPASADVTPSAASAGEQGTGGVAPMADASGSDFLSRLAQSLRDNSSMLMAFGGATMTGGLGRGLQAAAASAADANSRRQAPQTVRLRQPGGGEVLMMWDPVQRQYVLAPVAGTAALPSRTAANAPYAEGATATNPQTGQRMIFRNGQWQPM